MAEMPSRFRPGCRKWPSPATASRPTSCASAGDDLARDNHGFAPVTQNSYSRSRMKRPGPSPSRHLVLVLLLGACGDDLAAGRPHAGPSIDPGYGFVVGAGDPGSGTHAPPPPD